MSPEEKYDFIAATNLMAERVHQSAREKGFWDKPRNTGECFMLMVTELCEGFEDYRKGKEKSDHIPDFSPLEEELADTVIRIMDFAASHKMLLGEAIVAKIEFNKTRERLHGKKF